MPIDIFKKHKHNVKIRRKISLLLRQSRKKVGLTKELKEVPYKGH